MTASTGNAAVKKCLREYDPLVAGIGARSKSSCKLLAAVSADNDSKQGRNGNDAGFLSLTKFHWSVPSCFDPGFDKLEFVARWCSQEAMIFWLYLVVALCFCFCLLLS